MHYQDAVAQLADLFPATGSRYRNCYRKQAYATLADVLEVKERRKAASPGLQLTAYHCEIEDHWHLTSHEPSEAQMARAMARMRETSEATRLEVARLEAEIDRLGRQVADGWRAVRRRSRQITRPRSVAHLQALYREQRAAVMELMRWSIQRAKAMTERSQTLIVVDEWALLREERTLAALERLCTHLCEIEEEAAAERHDFEAHIAAWLKRLDVCEAEDVAWLREQMNQHYALPAQAWR
jgi:hypothetical protein